MKIVAVRIYLLRIGSLHPVLVELVTDEGLTGVGEAGIAYGHGGTAAAGMIKDLAEAIVLGRDPMRIEELWSEMYDHSFWAKGGGAIVFAGISAIETALWDIKGKALGAPAYELLGGKVRDDVRVYANGWSFRCVTPADYARAGEKVVADGFDALKCYPLAVPREGGGIKHVTRRMIDREAAEFAYQAIRALRDAVGPGVDIMLDLSGGLTTDETIRLCRRWAELDILFVDCSSRSRPIPSTRGRWRSSPVRSRFRSRSASGSTPATASAPSWSGAPRTSSSRTSATPAASWRRRRSRPWPRPSTCGWRRTSAPARSRPRPPSRSTPVSPTS
jgi:hypothetical protein